LQPFKVNVRKLKTLGLTESLEVGYRYLHIDYDKSDFEFVGSLAGPLIGVSWLL
jgi:hypothetical protein